MSVITVTDVHHVGLPVRDLTRSCAFYCDVLGLRLLPRPEGLVPGVWLAAGADRQLHLIESPVPADNSSHHVAFQVVDIDAVAAAMRAAGLELRGPTRVGSGRQAFLSDPDGHLVELHQPA